jgi:UDPglucose 6-dehydrogenase
MDLKGKAAVITGGSRGIGYTVAEALAKQGCNLLIISRTREELEAAQSALKKYCVQIEICPADVSREEEVEKAVNIIKDKFRGQADILINAAGIYGPIGPLTENDPAEWRRVIDINLIGVFLMSRALIPFLKNRGQGIIINFGGGGEGPLSNFSGYAASKGAICRLTETMAAELRDFNIAVNAVTPGPANTKFLDDLLAAGPEKAGKEIYAQALKQKQEGGAPPEKTAELILFLVSGAARGLSGKIFSAVWDDYKRFPGRTGEIMKSDVFTVRRVRPSDRGLKLLRRNAGGVQPRKIGVIGLWQLGEVYSACLAEIGHQVAGLSENKEVVKKLADNIPPISEPHLEELIKSNKNAGRLSYTSDYRVLADCDIVWITHDVPVDAQDRPDLKPVWDSLEKSLPYLRSGTLIAVSSQLPIGTSEKIKKFISEKRPDLKFDYAYLPENLRFGDGVECFLDPDRIVAGADSPAVFEKIEAVFGDLKGRLIKTSVISAEMSKHALNAFLAGSLSFIYDIADACEATGADIIEVAKALKADERIGKKAYLDASLGFSGGTLGRDLRVLLSLEESAAINLPILRSIVEKNNNRIEKAVSRFKKELESLKDSAVAIFGVAFKAGTPNLNRSRALEIADLLKKEGVRVRLHDPQACREDIISDPYEAARDSGGILVFSAWPEFRNLDFVKLRKVMREPAIFFDSRNFLFDKQAEIKAAGFRYLGTGR